MPGDDGPENSGGVTHSSALATAAAAKDANIKMGEIAAFILLCSSTPNTKLQVLLFNIQR